MNLLDADYAAIECRIVNWLAGQEDALARFRAYDAAQSEEEKYALDPYRLQAAHIYGIPVEDVDDFPQRFVGKSAELGCGFGMGPPKFRGSCKEKGKYVLPVGLEFTAVKTWRGTHKQVPKLWYGLEECAKNAIIKKGKVFTYRLISFKCFDIEGTPFLIMRLPSGRKLAYPRPRIIPHSRFEGNTEIVFFGHIKGQLWGDVSTWGGTFAENATQAVAADIMCSGAQNAEAMGYEIAALIHDQALSYYQESWQTVEEFVMLLTALPPWANGLPIQAKGALVPFYKKD